MLIGELRSSLYEVEFSEFNFVYSLDVYFLKTFDHLDRKYYLPRKFKNFRLQHHKIILLSGLSLAQRTIETN